MDGFEYCSKYPIIHTFTSFSSSSANNLEVFFMFPQAKNRQEGKALSLTPQANLNDWSNSCLTPLSKYFFPNGPTYSPS